MADDADETGAAAESAEAPSPSNDTALPDTVTGTVIGTLTPVPADVPSSPPVAGAEADDSAGAAGADSAGVPAEAPFPNNDTALPDTVTGTVIGALTATSDGPARLALAGTDGVSAFGVAAVGARLSNETELPVTEIGAATGALTLMPSAFAPGGTS